MEILAVQGKGKEGEGGKVRGCTAGTRAQKVIWGGKDFLPAAPSSTTEAMTPMVPEKIKGREGERERGREGEREREREREREEEGERKRERGLERPDLLESRIEVGEDPDS